MVVTLSDIEHIGILPSKADGRASTMDHGDTILDIAASSINALGYSPPPFPKDEAVKAACVNTTCGESHGKRLNIVGDPTTLQT